MKLPIFPSPSKPPNEFLHKPGLSSAGISPKMAQTLARHSDVRLTMNVYTHTDLADQTAAIAALPGPPAGKIGVVG